jgi:hypothetical protein
MRTSTSDRLTAATAEQLLDGGDGPADLRRLLAAAAGPGTARELAGEAAALAAFADAPRASSLPSEPTRRPSMLSTALSKILAAKAVAAVVLLAGATGGVALAATVTGAPDAPPADRPAATRTAPPSAVPGTGGNGGENGRANGNGPQTGADGAGSRPTDSPASPEPSLAGLCTAWAAGAGGNPGGAKDNPAFGALVDAAGSPDDVDAYCADLTDEDAPDAETPDEDAPDEGSRGADSRGTDRDRRQGPPADTPAGTRAAERPSAPPTAAPGNPDHPAGPPADAPRQDGDANEHGASGSSSGRGHDGD